MARSDVVAQKLATARQRLRAADEIFARPLDEFLPDEPARDLACPGDAGSDRAPKPDRPRLWVAGSG